jgi:hypothetical protein
LIAARACLARVHVSVSLPTDPTVTRQLVFVRVAVGYLGMVCCGKKKSHAERGATTGAAVGAALGSPLGPFGAGIGAGFGGATGYLAGRVRDDLPP